MDTWLRADRNRQHADPAAVGELHFRKSCANLEVVNDRKTQAFIDDIRTPFNQAKEGVRKELAEALDVSRKVRFRAISDSKLKYENIYKNQNPHGAPATTC